MLNPACIKEEQSHESNIRINDLIDDFKVILK